MIEESDGRACRYFPVVSMNSQNAGLIISDNRYYVNYCINDILPPALAILFRCWMFNLVDNESSNNLIAGLNL
jgi:hypothetical protein